MTGLQPTRTAAPPRRRAGTPGLPFAVHYAVLLLLYAGGAETSRTLMLSSRLSEATTELAVILAQYDEVDDLDIDMLVDAARQRMGSPAPPRFAVVFSEIRTDADGAASVTWSLSSANTHPLTAHDPFALPRQLALPNVSYVVVQTRYDAGPAPVRASGWGWRAGAAAADPAIPLHAEVVMRPQTGAAVLYRPPISTTQDESGTQQTM